MAPSLPWLSVDDAEARLSGDVYFAYEFVCQSPRRVPLPATPPRTLQRAKEPAASTGSRTGAAAHHPQTVLDRSLHDPVVVPRDEEMDAPFEERAQQRVESLVGLAEVDARAAGAEILETRPTRGARPERFADRIVTPGLVRRDLGQPFPRLTDPRGQQVARYPEAAVSDAPLADCITPVEILDPHVAMLDDRPAMVPEEAPDLPRRSTDLEGERVFLHTLSIDRHARECEPAAYALRSILTLTVTLVPNRDRFDAGRRADRRPALSKAL